MWTKLFELAGGADAPLVVLPTASERPEAGSEYVADLQALGATDVRSVEIRARADAFDPERVRELARARGVFFTGGDQNRITAALLGTPALDAIRALFARGGVLAGTSAGLACMSEVMITGEGDFDVIRGGAVATAPGLGFLATAILDQHFVARQRLNRLLSVVIERGDQLGVGVDERTTLWIDPSLQAEVLGEGSVVILDPRAAAERRAIDEARPRLGIRDLRLHVLLPGDRFDLSARPTDPSRAAPASVPAPVAAGDVTTGLHSRPHTDP